MIPVAIFKHDDEPLSDAGPSAACGSTGARCDALGPPRVLEERSWSFLPMEMVLFQEAAYEPDHINLR